jgi:hypothetical protein
VGVAHSLHAHGLDGTGSSIAPRELTFRSRDLTVATVDSLGVVHWTTSMQAACGPARGYRYYLNGADDPNPYSGGVNHSFARDLYDLPVGQSAIQFEGFGAGLPNNCDRLMYDDAYPPSNSTLQTRLTDSTRADGVHVRRWRVESRGSHIAVCGYTNNRGVFVTTGPQYYLPFAISVTEVPYPYPKYP